MKSTDDLLKAIEHVKDCSGNQVVYNEGRKLFNTRFKFRPAIIWFPVNAQQVADVVNAAAREGIKLNVKGGGHDHEGESMNTDGWVLNMRKMKKVAFEDNTVRLGPGWIFMELISKLNDEKKGIPHGTCQSVGITGFTLGGGWGPWTRRYGMCCESLVEATIVLGPDAEEGQQIITATATNEHKDLLWALRGGGGYSYGIVTELVIETFDLPKTTHKFRASWYKKTPALSILEAWEKAIDYSASPNLIGTNLQIMGKQYDGEPVETSVHECNFFGYYDGTKQDVRDYLEEYFPGDLAPQDLEIWDEKPGSQAVFNSWEMVHHEKRVAMATGRPILKDIPLEDDAAAPHKITSRLVEPEMWDDEARKTLIRSLESKLLPSADETLSSGVYGYCTLGAISGEFYRDYLKNPPAFGSSFPYPERPYTIQYQVWWNTKQIIPEANDFANRAMDWIETTRTMDFPQTSGAFISFKDAGVPTKTYFMQNYDELMKVKENYSMDKNNLFRSRKTII